MSLNLIMKHLHGLEMAVANKSRLNETISCPLNVIMSNTETHLLTSSSLQADFSYKPLYEFHNLQFYQLKKTCEVIV